MGRRLEYEVKTSVRLNMSNPQHVKINDVIQNLDPKIFKSKNQFIIDAIQFYIDNYGKETFVIKKKEKERAEYIRSEDIDDIKEEVIEAATNEARKEVIKLLGGVISGMNVGQPVIMQAANSEAQELTEDVMDDADVAGLARLRDDIEKKDKEMKRMGDRIESLEDKIISVATENKKEAESKAEPQESQSVPQAEKKMVDTVAVPQNMQAVANGIPVYYQIPVVDGTGNVVQRLPIERSVRKSSNSGVASLFARLSFKKKSRADIVKLVASGDLVPAQLVQIKSAIEKGLTESQLVELINNNISAEKMKEIIEIAVLENSMAD